MDRISVSVAGARREGSSAKKEVHQFTWTQQGSRVLEQLRALYLSADQEENVGHALGIQPDVVLFSGDGDFVEAHKMVLSLCSPFFQDVFLKISRSKCRKIRDGASVVVLNNVNSSQLKHLIQFIYTGEVTISLDEKDEFLEVGRAFKIDGITHSGGSVAHPNSNSLVVNKTAGGEHPQTLISDGERGQDSFFDEEVDVSYGSYPVKMEVESEEDYETSQVPEDDPLGSVEGEEDDPLGSVEGEEDDENDLDWSEGDNESDEKDPTFKVKSSSAKRPRREVTDIELATAWQNPERRQSSSWLVRDAPSEEVLKQEWRIRRRVEFKNCSTVTYYCAFGQKRFQCPARIKQQIWRDGTITWLSNQVEHNFHKETAEASGFSQEKSQFLTVHAKRPRPDVTDAELAAALNETKQQETPTVEWTVQDAVSEEDLKQNWRILQQKQRKADSIITYYCAHGQKWSQCPVRLRKQTRNDGTVTWFNNRNEHNFHKTLTQKTNSSLKLSMEQRQFILQCLKNGASTTTAILARFKAKGRSPPQKKLVDSLLQRLQTMNHGGNMENQELSQDPNSLQGEPSN